MPTTTPIEEIKALKSSKHARLVSFENSNSWIKRHDSEGTLLIQAGYRENPNGYQKADDENPLIIAGTTRRWYGARACQGAHQRIYGRSKLDTAREAFTASLRPSDDQRELIVIASHWDTMNLESLKPALIGQYKVIRNGSEITAKVIDVICIPEGMGSFHAVANSLKPGATLLFELGFGTAEELVIGADGELEEATAQDSLGIAQLATAIGNDPIVRNLALDNASEINLSAISKALQEPTFGRIGESQWHTLKAKYVSAHLKALQARMRTAFGDRSQTITNMVLTGGGASLLANFQPKVKDVFIVPDCPQLASVRGAYEFQLSKVG